MTKKYFVPISIIGLILFICFFTVYSTKITPKQTSVISMEENAITMKEAITKGYEYIGEISKDAKLAMIMSADAKDKQTIKSGEFGKRSIWNLSFIDTKSINNNKDDTTTFYYIRISDGKVYDYHTEKIKSFDKKIIDDPYLIIDSNDAVAIAKNQKGLNPGKDWAIGYHFKMSLISSDDQKTEPQIIVVGLSPSGNFANIYINEKTGQIVKAIEKVNSDGKGNDTWKNF